MPSKNSEDTLDLMATILTAAQIINTSYEETPEETLKLWTHFRKEIHNRIAQRGSVEGTEAGNQENDGELFYQFRPQRKIIPPEDEDL